MRGGHGGKLFVSFFEERKRFFLKKEAKTFYPFGTGGWAGCGGIAPGAAWP
jgi:hypothetical protein